MGVLSREFLKKLRLREGEIAIVDMEAGVEHFGRGIDEGIDGVLLVVEPSLESITLAERVKGLASGMGKRIWAVINKVTSQGMASRIKGELERRKIEVIGAIPHDEGVFEACLEGRALQGKEASQEAKRILDQLFSKIP